MPDDICNRIRHLNRCVDFLDACRDRDKFVEAIKNGTPLPKGHGRLIDADKLKEVYETTEDAEYCQWTLYGVTSEIDDAETIIEADTESEVEE